MSSQEPTLTPAAFAAKWRNVTTSEKAAAQAHFIDICRMLGEPTPHEADPIGTQFAFEKRVVKAGGGDGYADVWKRDFSAWEYKGEKRDLKAAYIQLLSYKDDIGKPPVLKVSDIETAKFKADAMGGHPDLSSQTDRRVGVPWITSRYAHTTRLDRVSERRDKRRHAR